MPGGDRYREAAECSSNFDLFSMTLKKRRCMRIKKGTVEVNPVFIQKFKLSTASICFIPDESVDAVKTNDKTDGNDEPLMLSFHCGAPEMNKSINRAKPCG